MDKEREAWSKVTEQDRVIRNATNAKREALLELIGAKKEVALENLTKHPQHAEAIVDQLVSSVVNLLS